MTSLLMQVDHPAFTHGRHSDDPAHAGVPGTGPLGMTCGACLWAVERVDPEGRRALKCSLTDWDGEPRTDVRAEDPACAYFDAAQRPTR
jgi:hypothetical protein